MRGNVSGSVAAEAASPIRASVPGAHAPGYSLTPRARLHSGIALRRFW